jgi:hypothetical protein
MTKDLIIMFLLGLSTLLFLYIPQFSACCREYVGEIYELEYYYHPPILFLFSFFLILFLFSFFFYFSLYSIPTTIVVAYLSFMKIYSYEILFCMIY